MSTPVTELYAVLSRSGTAVDLVATLLAHCRRDHKLYREWLIQQNWNRAGEMALAGRIDDAVAKLVKSPQFQPAVDGGVFNWSALSSSLLNGDYPYVVTARIIANRFAYHFDEKALGRLYLKSSAYPAGGQRPIRQGDLIYSPSPTLSWYQDAGWSRPSEHPHSVETFPPVSPLWSFRIAESDLFETIDVRLDLSARRLVDEMFGQLNKIIVAACVPNRELGSEYALDQIEKWTEDRQGYFFGVHAADLDRQRLLFEQATACALSGGANVVLFPELSATPDVAAHAIQVAARAVTQPTLLIPGSWHASRAEGHLLSGRILWRPAGNDPVQVEVIHRKFRPLQRYRMDGADYDEWLGTWTAKSRPTIRVYLGNTASFTVLICADVIGPEIQGLLKEVGPTFVFVPAMSKTHGPFQRLAAHVNGWQGMTAVSMVPGHAAGEDAGAWAVFCTPYPGALPLSVGSEFILGGHPGTTFAHHNSTGAATTSPRQSPAVCFYRLGSSHCIWQEISV
ncbi:MAG: hypothetical protein U0871_01320 [Gemmataceae bacterium]